jgi:hypothetical protein
LKGFPRYILWPIYWNHFHSGHHTFDISRLCLALHGYLRPCILFAHAQSLWRISDMVECELLLLPAWSWLLFFVCLILFFPNVGNCLTCW